MAKQISLGLLMADRDRGLMSHFDIQCPILIGIYVSHALFRSFFERLIFDDACIIFASILFI